VSTKANAVPPDNEDDDVDLSNVTLSHYRLSKIKQQDLQLKEGQGEYGLEPGNEMGSAKARDKKEEFLSTILQRLNELFITDNLTDDDMLNYARTVADKVGENERVMHQLRNNSPGQAFLGDFPQAVDDAVMGSSEAHQNQMMKILSNPGNPPADRTRLRTCRFRYANQQNYK
jgi:type I restriction enzyme R subunit